MTEELNLDEVMSRRFELDEQITAIQNKNKVDLAPLTEEMQLCESYIKAELLKSGAQQWKSSATGHMTFWTTKDSVTVEDMDAVIHRILAEAPPPELTEGVVPPDAWQTILDHIQNTGLWALLNKAVNKTQVKDMIEAAAPPPGVKYTTFKDLAWRRGKI